MPTGDMPPVYMWGLNAARMPVALVRMNVEVPDGVDCVEFPMPEELLSNPEVFYAVPQDIE